MSWWQSDSVSSVTWALRTSSAAAAPGEALSLHDKVRKWSLGASFLLSKGQCHVSATTGTEYVPGKLCFTVRISLLYFSHSDLITGWSKGTDWCSESKNPGYAASPSLCKQPGLGHQTGKKVTLPVGNYKANLFPASQNIVRLLLLF